MITYARIVASQVNLYQYTYTEGLRDDGQACQPRVTVFKKLQHAVTRGA